MYNYYNSSSSVGNKCVKYFGNWQWWFRFKLSIQDTIATSPEYTLSTKTKMPHALFECNTYLPASLSFGYILHCDYCATSLWKQQCANKIQCHNTKSCHYNQLQFIGHPCWPCWSLLIQRTWGTW